MEAAEQRALEDRYQTLADSIGFALRLEAGGVYMKDYHTIQAPAKVSNLPTRTLELRQAEIRSKESHRVYYADQYAIVCLWKSGEAGPTLSQIAEHLAWPCFQLYLGRKACPLALPLMAYVDEEAENWKDALDRAAFRYRLRLDCLLNHPQQKNNTVASHRDSAIRYFWEGDDHAGFTSHAKVERWDTPASRTRWQFQPRTEYMAP